MIHNYLDGINGAQDASWIEYSIPVPWGTIEGKLHNEIINKNQYHIAFLQY